MFVKRTATAVMGTVMLLCGCARQDMSQQDLDLQMMEQIPSSTISSSSFQEQTVLHLPITDGGVRNPFSSAGILPSITPLLYQSLYRLDNNYCPQPQLAASVSYEEGGLICTIVLCSDAVFSDGTAVTADDVVASLRETLKYPDIFPDLANTVESCRAVDETVIITLLEADRNFSSYLTFPVCKAGTQSDDIPIGSGPFVCGETNATRLQRNEYHRDSTLNIESVELIPVADQESLEYMLKIGVIDFYSSGDISADSYSYGSSEYFAVNRLTYLGIHRKSGSPLSVDAFLEQLLEHIQKEQLVSYACGNTAQMTDVPFHPGYWQQMGIASSFKSVVSTDTTSAETAETQADLETMIHQLGYEERDEDGYWVRYYCGSPYRLSFSILVNSENHARLQLASLMRDQLAEIGIELNVVSESYPTYIQSVAAMKYDFYIGEVQLGVGMDLSNLFSEENSAKLGFPYDPELLDAALRLKSGQAEYAEFLEIFKKSSIMEPLYYQRGSISYSRNLTASFIENYRELLFQIQWY